MRQIWKYLINIIDDNQNIIMPTGARLVHVGQQHEQIGLWFEVDPQEKCSVSRSFRVFGTGHPIENGSHIGTVVMIPFVWHVYDTTRDQRVNEND